MLASGCFVGVMALMLEKSTLSEAVSTEMDVGRSGVLRGCVCRKKPLFFCRCIPTRIHCLRMGFQ